MTEKPFVATPDVTLNELAYHMLQYDCGAIPIVDDLEEKHLVGIITDRDIIARAVSQDQNPMEVRAEDVLSSRVYTVHPDTPLPELLELFRAHKFRRVPIVDAQNRVVGILTLTDLVRRTPEAVRPAVDRTLREVVAAP